MTFDFVNNEDFKDHLKQKEKEIQNRTKDGIQNHENFKQLQGLFVSYKHQTPINSFTAILIEKPEIENLCDDAQDRIFETLNSIDARSSNHIILNRNLEILQFEQKQFDEGGEARRLYLELSKDCCVFLISPQPLHYFVDEQDVGEAIFFTEDDYNSFIKLKNMSEIFEVFKEYREHLKNRDTYTKFFVSKVTKKSLHKHLLDKGETIETEEVFLQNTVHLLENKPEDRFREDLRTFLKQKLKVTLGREHLLEDFRRLDIVIIDELGNLYFIEVKWVGLSIHHTGQKLGTCYEQKDINPDAVIQSVGYIEKLFNSKERINTGYLAVFDARDEDLPDTVENFDIKILEEDTKPFYSKFIKIHDFRVKNYHPN